MFRSCLRWANDRSVGAAESTLARLNIRYHRGNRQVKRPAHEQTETAIAEERTMQVALEVVLQVAQSVRA